MTQQDTSFTGILTGLTGAKGRYRAEITPDWGQGRAGFGGIVAALGLKALRREIGEAPPLRSLNIAFIGPAMGELEIDVRPLRLGRTAAFLDATLLTRGTVAATVTGCFGPDRPSSLHHPVPRRTDLPPPEEAEALVPVEGVTPTFIQNFEIRGASPDDIFAGGTRGEISWWVRHKDPTAWGGEGGLVSALDVLPPAAANLLSTPCPVSSLSWMVDFPTSDLSTDDGWWFLSSSVDYATSGFSGQSMAAWSRDGRLAALHRQSVGIFG